MSCTASFIRPRYGSCRSGIAQPRRIVLRDRCRRRAPWRRCTDGTVRPPRGGPRASRAGHLRQAPALGRAPGRDRQPHPAGDGRPRGHQLGPRHRAQRLHHRALTQRLRPPPPRPGQRRDGPRRRRRGALRRPALPAGRADRHHLRGARRPRDRRLPHPPVEGLAPARDRQHRPGTRPAPAGAVAPGPPDAGTRGSARTSGSRRGPVGSRRGRRRCGRGRRPASLRVPGPGQRPRAPTSSARRPGIRPRPPRPGRSGPTRPTARGSTSTASATR